MICCLWLSYLFSKFWKINKWNNTKLLKPYPKPLIFPQWCLHIPWVSTATTDPKYTINQLKASMQRVIIYVLSCHFCVFLPALQNNKQRTRKPRNQTKNKKTMTEPNSPLGCAILFIFALFYLIVFFRFLCSPPARWGSLDFNFDKDAIPSSPHPPTPPLPALGAAGHVWTRTLFATKNARKHVRENVSIDARKHVKNIYQI